jgi:putative hemolysin
MNRLALFAAVAPLLSLVVGCAADPAPSTDNEGANSSEIGLANPAAVHCTNLGYTPSGDD